MNLQREQQRFPPPLKVLRGRPGTQVGLDKG
jgi:hypothetical protein